MRTQFRQYVFTHPPDAHFTGDMNVQGSLILAGRITGRLIVARDLRIEAGAQVIGDISAVNVDHRGRVRGSIRAMGRIALRDGSIQNGNIQAPSIHIEEKTIFEGKISLL
ncbi:MAG: polymer-forming cytoskeletal protein [Marinilabiliales bacterium]|nr:polymer-forming cytoskeletal protein [Marinilabiliales bacterium]